MTTLEKTLDYLDRGLVHYVHSTHSVAYTAREVAAVEHISPHKVAKTIVFVTEEGYAMAVVPADALVDLEALRRLLGVDALRLATEEELAELFPGAELGSMPPFGNLFGLPVFFDRRLLTEKIVAFNAGTHRDLIQMNLVDFLRMSEPLFGDFAIHAESSAGI
jgi:Ala-tRNA(Pro) deacylase